MQIQALLAAQGGVGAGGAATGPNIGSHMEVAKPAIFNGEAERVGGFITACRLYIKMKLRGNTVEEQIQWVLTYVQGGSADVWKENVMEELEAGEVEYESVEEFFTVLRKEFGGGEEESVKAVELRKLEQGGKTMEEFIQEFKRAARGSGYEGRPLVEEFKRGMNGGIRRKLMEAENPPTSIENWYRRATALDRNWRESRREEARLREKKEAMGRAPKQEQRRNLPRPLVEEFKRGMNGRIQRKLMEAENPPTSIKQWYRRATALDRNWRESRREEERLRGKKEAGGGGQKQERQSLP